VRTRLAVMTPLAAARESYARAYPYFIQLHMLQEVESMRVLHDQATTRPLQISSSPSPSTTGTTSSSSTSTASATMERYKQQLTSLHNNWVSRLSRTTPSFRIREPVLSLRRALHDQYGMKEESCHDWLSLAKEARSAAQFVTADGALIRAAGTNGTLSNHTNPLLLPSFDARASSHLTCDTETPRIKLERARLLRARDRLHDALLYLEKESKTFPSVDEDGSKAMKSVRARACLLMAKWIAEGSAKDSSAVLQQYKDAVYHDTEYALPLLFMQEPIYAYLMMM
jgi:hypothetical protein